MTELKEPQSFLQAEKYVDSLLSRNRYTPDSPMSNDTFRPSVSIQAYVSYVSNVIRELESNSKGISFAISQTALHMLNPIMGMGQIWNPATTFGAPPFAGGMTTHAFDIGSPGNNPGTKIYKSEDRLKAIYEGTASPERGNFIQNALDSLSAPVNSNAVPSNKLRQAEYNMFNADSAYPSIITIDQEVPNPANIKEIENPYIPNVKSFVPDYEKIFQKYQTGPAVMGEGGGTDFYKPQLNARTKTSPEYATKMRAKQNLDSFFSALDANNGYVDTDFETLTDDQTYIPFYLVDLRQPSRRLYFRAFLSELRESFDTKWNIEDYYGRIDPVMTYKNTSRMWNIGFTVVANSKQGFATMWKKISNFMKMLYPTYKQGVLVAAPVVQLRIGDVLSDGNGDGLPGVILQPNFDYTKSPWEINSYRGEQISLPETGKAPMCAEISFQFQVIHKKAPSNDENYNFDSRNVRRIGRLEGDILNIEGRTEEE